MPNFHYSHQSRIPSQPAEIPHFPWEKKHIQHGFPKGFPNGSPRCRWPPQVITWPLSFHRGEGPRGDVQIQDLVAELILHRVEGDTWENIIELCVCVCVRH